MAKLRSINTEMWSDVWFEELTPTEKLLFIYLITNTHNNMLGIYEISLRKISFETGIDLERVRKALEGFERDNKVFYKDGFIVLINFLKHQSFNPNMKKSAISTYNELPDKIKLPDLQLIDTKNYSKGFETLTKGFESLTKGFESLRKIEVEREVEYEVEIEEEDEKEKEPEKKFLSAAYQLQEFSKKYFHEKFLDEGSLDVFDKLIRLDGYSAEDIQRAILFARGDDFWTRNFLTPKKLRKKNPEGVAYIDVFLSQTMKTNEKAKTSARGASLADLAEIIQREFGDYPVR